MGRFACQTCVNDCVGWCNLGNDYPVRYRNRCDDYEERDEDDEDDDNDDDVDGSAECPRCGNDAYWTGDCYECDECGYTFD